MNLNGVGNSSPVQKLVNQPVYREVSTDSTDGTVSRSSDRLELSGTSHLMQALKRNDIRTDKVAQIKSQIDAGTYESDDKLDVAADRMLDDLSK
ncbi:MAG TPA: flagellar biosynthesis anti-sigma factor FlgM [Tepidisphaeraceae bacterium]|jgi:anti-sigma28 factor (negative regulator of flagellin synthesis)|nr:flagellar biosynthesis anti-sigma factor FlgM [Tepidisphaeraceae bacterium]